MLQEGVSPALAKHIPHVIETCKQHGLDPYDLVIEEYNADEIAELGAYGGFPVRYPHFNFGQQYETLHNQYHSGMGKIYEMVINNDPTYMYLQRNNPIVDNLTVVAHALAHSDFFKNNIYFKNTNRDMMNIMANHGQKIRKYMDIYGHKKVAKFLDSCLSVDDLIDPDSTWGNEKHNKCNKINFELPVEQFTATKINTNNYMDRFVNPSQYINNQKKKYRDQKRESMWRYPPKPVKDVLLFILKNIRLEQWQQNVLSIVRQESIYYRPQMLTKVLNEGWASYWDSFIMTKCGLAGDTGIFDYAKHHAGVLGGKYAMNNPYRLGNYLLRHVEERWNKGQYGREWENCDDDYKKRDWDTKANKGLDKIFEIRKNYNDVNFINEFFTQDFCDKHEYFEYELDEKKNKYVVVSKDHEKIKEHILKMYTNGGRPLFSVTSLDKTGIELTHKYTGLELDINYVEKTLKMLYNIVNIPITVKSKVSIDPNVKMYGSMFSVLSEGSSGKQLASKIFKYNGEKFKHWEDFKYRDFPNI